VLTRLAQGKTNREIAMALKVSPRTIEKHVERILAKLGATNRTIAALLSARASD
jgi:DNA-binding NarL/FixJ family response regulator